MYPTPMEFHNKNVKFRLLNRHYQVTDVRKQKYTLVCWVFAMAVLGHMIHYRKLGLALKLKFTSPGPVKLFHTISLQLM